MRLNTILLSIFALFVIFCGPWSVSDARADDDHHSGGGDGETPWWKDSDDEECAVEHIGLTTHLSFHLPVIMYGGDSFDMVDYNQGDGLFAGFMVQISFGYRLGLIGLYLDQELGAVWAVNSDLKNLFADATFLGGTYVVLRLYVPVIQTFDVTLGFGMGGIYSSGVTMTVGMDGKNQRAFPVVFDEKLHSSSIFAFKFETGFTWYFTDFMGIGVDFNYNLGINWMNRFKKNQKVVLIHHIDPGIHLNFLI